MKISELTPNEKNPRKISDTKLAMLKKSLETFGDLGSIVVNKTTGRLVSGHQRIKSLPNDAEIKITKRLAAPNKQGTVALGHCSVGQELFAYREVLVDEATESAMMLAANQQGGEFDFSILPDVLLEIDQANLDLELTGFEEDDLKNILAPTDLPSSKEDNSKDIIVCPKCKHEFSS